MTAGCDGDEDRNVYVEVNDLLKQLTAAIGKDEVQYDGVQDILTRSHPTSLPPPQEKYVWTPYKENLPIKFPEKETEENADKSDQILNTAYEELNDLLTQLNTNTNTFCLRRASLVPT